MPTTKLIGYDVSRDSVCMGDDVDGRHEIFIAIACSGVDDIRLHCTREVAARGYIPRVQSGSTWVVEADGLPFAVLAQDADGRVTVTRAGRAVEEIDGKLALSFSYQLRRDPAELLMEIDAGRRPSR